VQREHAPTEWQITIMEVKRTDKVVQVEVVMVEDLVCNDVVMLVEVVTMEAAMVEGMTTRKALMALTTSATVVLIVLLDLMLIQGIYGELDMMLAAIGLDVTTTRLVPKLLMVTDVILPRVAPTLTVNVP